MQSALIWSALLAVALVSAIQAFINLLTWYARYRATLDAVKDIGCVKHHWFLGHLQHVQPTEAALMTLVKWMEQFPKCTKIFFGPVVFFVNCYHPDLLKIILGTEEPKDDVSYGYLRPWIGDGLLTSSGEKWKRNRRLLTPAFHFDVLKGYLKCTNVVALEMLRKWSNRDGQPVSVEMFNDVSLMALDNLLQCIMSKKSGCQSGDNTEYLDAVKNVTEISMNRLHNPLHQVDFIFYYLTSAGRRYKQALKVAHEYTEKAIFERKRAMRSRESTPNSHIDFLDILLKSKDENGGGLTHQEICDEVDTFVFEGHDTVTSGISFAFYNLAKYPVYQEKCRREVEEIIGKRGTVEWNDLPKLTYLTMFIKESMRIFPPVFNIGRITSQPLYFPRGFGSDQYNIDSKGDAPSDSSRTVPKGLRVGVGIFQVHRNPNIWEDPETFNPERFTTENIAKRSPHAYIPFSSGPRNCIGQHFAMNEMKIVLSLALSQYRFSVDKTFPEPELEPHIILRSKTGIHVKVEKL